MMEKGRVVASRYEILECLGTGGMGAVYRVRDRVLQEDVALKVLRPELIGDEAMGQRFLAEIRLARRVTHPSVCRIHEYGEDGELRFISMELVHGVDLRRLVAATRGLPAREALDLAIQAAEGLAAIHDVGIVHRDLKTPNLMRDRSGRVKVMDFGIAKQARGLAGASLTATGMILGTPEYMSPEQAGAGTVDERSDVYALGVVLFEMLTGHVPFHGETPMATALKQIQEAPPLEGPGAEGIAGDLLPLLRRALAKDPAARFQTAREMAAAMTAARDGLSPAPPSASLGAAAAPPPTLVEAALPTQQAAPTWHEATRSTGGLLPGLQETAIVEDASPSMPALAPTRVGTTFAVSDVVAGRYRVVRFLAQGGMGEVYEADDLELGGKVALKTVKPEIAAQKGAIDRFKREIAMARKVTHPGVCRIFDLGRHPSAGGSDVTFLTMELLSGETLSERIRARGRLGAKDALPLATQMAAALDAAHAAGIVHRDFKSSNVMLVRGASGERAVVTDLGLARAIAPDTDTAALTGTGDVVGSPAYMAPEQVAGEAVSPATDVYALGVVLFEMVTGRWPFVADTPLSTAAKRLTERPPSPRTIVADLDPRWTDTILRCLERQPAARFERAGEVGRALAGEAAVRRARPSWWLPAGLAAAVVIGGLSTLALLRRPAPPDGAGPPSLNVRRSVAVLGFKNLAGPEASWVSTALAEMLRTEIAAGDRLRMVPGDAVGRTKVDLALGEADSLPPETLALLHRNLGADLVVLGSYLVLGDTGDAQMRLDLRVQDTARGTVVSASSATGTRDGLFDLVSSAGSSLRASLGLDAASAPETAAVKAARPSSAEAARLYAEGLAKLRVFDPRAAAGLLEQATAADPRQPLAHAGLATAWAALGYDAKATASAATAAELAAALPREDRLSVEGLKHETAGEWPKAAEVYKSLVLFYPDRLDFGLRLAAAQTAAGQPTEALATINGLRQLPPPLSEDPRLDLAEAAAAKGQNDYDRQKAAAARAAEKAQGMGSRLLFAQGRLMEARALVDLGKFEEAVAACGEARKVFEAAGDVASLAQTENTVGMARVMSGNAKEAKARFEAALADFRRLGHQRGVAQQLLNLGNVAADAGDLRGAARLYAEGVEAYSSIGDKAGVGRVSNNLGTLLWEAREPEKALEAYGQALVAWREVGESRNAAEALFNMGEALHDLGRLNAARTRLQESLKINQDAGATANEAEILMHLGEIDLAESRLSAARRTLEEALTAFRSLKDPHDKEPRAVRALAKVLRRQGNVEAAQEREAEALKLEEAAKTRAAAQS
jgi:serine/threonine protein kinase/tetratricopeptide (TPR) repeat protein